MPDFYQEETSHATMNSANNGITPIVSCIMPTYNRRSFISSAILYFLRQDYLHLELIIIDDGTDSIADLLPPDHPSISYYRLEKKITLGAKLNMACSYAQGQIIVHWDDDDWYSPGRVTYQVHELLANNVDICGINKLFYLDFTRKKGFVYQYPVNQRKWLLGSSLCYQKQFWETHRFADVNVGMDGLFVWSTTPDRVHILDDSTIAVHMIHPENVSPKRTDGAWWKPYPIDGIRNIMGEQDWKRYQSNNGHTHTNVSETVAMVPQQKHARKYTYNIFACLVHEKEDCIIDMVLNLHHQDPSSAIIIYNGGAQQDLFASGFSYEEYGVIFYPDPVPMKWGYLHDFALKCMAFAAENFEFYTITMVDSDQLFLRSGYTTYLSDYLSGKENVGMLSSAPERVRPGDASKSVAQQAFREKPLWQPLLETFDGGDDRFVHWTFWPGTVFTSAAARDLVKIFRENILLKDIMQRTKIWATEEVILPTLVKLLGYEILQNPCCYDYIRYKQLFQCERIQNAFNDHNAYWVHPVIRNFDDPVRSLIRQEFDYYKRSARFLHDDIDFSPASRNHQQLLAQIGRIGGWLNDREASLLIHTTLKMLTHFSDCPNIVEIGSYHGKSTILFGTILSALAPSAGLYAIDMHDGRLGDEDHGLAVYPPSYDTFIENIERAGLKKLTHVVRARACEVSWNRPVSLLFIDGLHDYRNVASDFCHFEEWVEPGGFVVFHDYADYFPGVKKFVREILNAGRYKKTDQSESLIVLQKGQQASVATDSHGLTHPVASKVLADTY